MSEKKSIVKKVMDDIKESARKQHEIDKENFAAVKADSKARFEDATKPYPDFEEFKEAKGLKEKAKVVAKHAARNGKKIAEENRENYKKMLEEQRKHINEVTGMNKKDEE